MEPADSETTCEDARGLLSKKIAPIEDTVLRMEKIMKETQTRLKRFGISIVDASSSSSEDYFSECEGYGSANMQCGHELDTAERDQRGFEPNSYISNGESNSLSQESTSLTPKLNYLCNTVSNDNSGFNFSSNIDGSPGNSELFESMENNTKGTHDFNSTDMVAAVCPKNVLNIDNANNSKKERFEDVGKGGNSTDNFGIDIHNDDSQKKIMSYPLMNTREVKPRQRILSTDTFDSGVVRSGEIDFEKGHVDSDDATVRISLGIANENNMFYLNSDDATTSELVEKSAEVLKNKIVETAIQIVLENAESEMKSEGCEVKLQNVGSNDAFETGLLNTAEEPVANEMTIGRESNVDKETKCDSEVMNDCPYGVCNASANSETKLTHQFDNTSTLSPYDGSRLNSHYRNEFIESVEFSDKKVNVGVENEKLNTSDVLLSYVKVNVDPLNDHDDNDGDTEKDHSSDDYETEANSSDNIVIELYNDTDGRSLSYESSGPKKDVTGQCKSLAGQLNSEDEFDTEEINLNSNNFIEMNCQEVVNKINLSSFNSDEEGMCSQYINYKNEGANNKNVEAKKVAGFWEKAIETKKTKNEDIAILKTDEKKIEVFLVANDIEVERSVDVVDVEEEEELPTVEAGVKTVDNGKMLEVFESLQMTENVEELGEEEAEIEKAKLIFSFEQAPENGKGMTTTFVRSEDKVVKEFYSRISKSLVVFKRGHSEASTTIDNDVGSGTGDEDIGELNVGEQGMIRSDLKTNTEPTIVETPGLEKAISANKVDDPATYNFVVEHESQSEIVESDEIPEKNCTTDKRALGTETEKISDPDEIVISETVHDRSVGITAIDVITSVKSSINETDVKQEALLQAVRSDSISEFDNLFYDCVFKNEEEARDALCECRSAHVANTILNTWPSLINGEEGSKLLISAKNEEVLLVFLGVGGRINLEEAISKVIRAGNSKQLSLLLNQMADVNGVVGCGQTALHLAAEYNDTDCISVLLQHGAEINKTDRNGNTSIERAFAFRCKEAFEFLSNAGAAFDPFRKSMIKKIHCCPNLTRISKLC